MKNRILNELKAHAPFTLLGAAIGVIFAVVLRNMPYKSAYVVFYTLHPAHVLLSALVMSSLYRNYRCKSEHRLGELVKLLTVGYVGSIGVATVSDSIIPYFSELILSMPHSAPHIGFMEEWWLVLPLASIGIAIAYFKPTTKFPHAAHVMVSTGASLFHIIMAGGYTLNAVFWSVIFIFLFVSVWIPCCFSDIVFPLLFVGKDACEHKH